MTEARFTLTIPALTHHAAHDIAGRSRRTSASTRLPSPSTRRTRPRLCGNWCCISSSAGEAEDARAIAALAQGVITPVPQQDWVRESLQGLAPVTAGRFFLHGAHDRVRRRAGGISLEIDAGTAFGTGHHGTTEGCLLALDRILKRRAPRKILDVGCGTGVLAIAAARATGRPALASDIDPEAVRVTLANAALNGVKPLVSGLVAAGLSHPRITAHGPYDLIFANILARPLVSLATGLSRMLAPGGDLILSGLTADQIRWIEATYESRGLRLSRRIRRGNWASLVFTRPQTENAREGGHPGVFW